MKNTNEKRYHIRPEYLSMWGDYTPEDYVVTESELRDLAREWEKSEDELLEQLEEI